MAKGKKEPINITPPTPPQLLVKSERVKVVVMFNGDTLICDLQEAVDKESGARQAYIANSHTKLNTINLNLMLQELLLIQKLKYTILHGVHYLQK